jgi:hypothetical protein
MTDLLPIIFARGQNESVDPRVAPPDVHRLAQNVRWRKDGRPSKRYGVSALTTTNLDGGLNYMTQPVNAIGTWNDTPLLALGSGVRQFTGGAWTSAGLAFNGELAHWAPGERDIISRAESAAIGNGTLGQSGGTLVYLWDDGTSVFRCVKRTDGAMVRPTELYATGLYPRAISCTSFVHYLYRVGTALHLATYDPSTQVTTDINAGTLGPAGAIYDAVGRGGDLVIVYQSAIGTLTVKLFASLATPTLSQTQTVATTGGIIVTPTINSDATNNIFVAWLDSGGDIRFASWNNGLTASTGAAFSVQVDANNFTQPGIALESAGVCTLAWSGYVAATTSNYTRCVSVNANSTLATGISTFHGACLASKPFPGPAYGTFGTRDGMYAWCHTHNAGSTFNSTQWDDQRSFYLLQLSSTAASGSFLRRHLHAPNTVASTLAHYRHLADAVPTAAGYYTALIVTTRFGNTNNVEAFGLDSISAHSIFESQRYAARRIATAGRAAQFAGGALFEYTGSAEETGFTNFPVIKSITGGGGGALTTGAGVYLYRAVYEWLDGQGRRHRSAPSDPFAFTPGANNSATLVIAPLVAMSRLVNGTLSLHIYRTLSGQGTYHRVTPNVAPPSGAPGAAATVSYTDLMSDASAAINEFIYTDGGVLDNTLPPPCTFMTVCNGRVWLGGQLDRCVVTASKLLVDGEPTQFSDLDPFNVFLPQKCTGLASLDGTVVAFAREKIYLVQGDGPSDQGIGQFSPPQELPTDNGCVDWRSVVETSLGIFFQSKRGIFLLPRGFNTPLFIGAEVQDTLALFPIVVSATLVSAPSNGNGKLGEITVRFVLASTEAGTSSAIVTYDMRTQGWSVDYFGAGGPVLGLGGTWSDTFILPQLNGVTGALLNLFAESSAGYSDNGQFISTSLGTGDIRPFGVGGYGQFNKVLVMGEYRGNAQVNVQVSVDGAAADTYPFTVTAPDGPDGVVYLNVTPKIQKGASLRVTCTDGPDAGSGGAATEGFIMQALFIESELIGKTKRLPAGRAA